MAITRVYTKTGDDGITSLVGGVKVKKTNARIEAYGTVDELNSHLGLLVAILPNGNYRDMIIRIQSCLFNVCTNLATDQSQTPLYDSAKLPQGEIELLEQEVDRMMKLLPEKQGFILPGGTQAAAQAHVCRTVCRRAERRIVSLSEEAQITPETLQYVNRLSDYLFVLAKIINFNAGVNEIVWQNVCK